MYDYGVSSFDNGSRNGSISDMAVGKKLIVVGSYNTRNEWFCLDGYASRYESEGDYFTVGRVSGFSSFGTLRDGRNLPTVCAPGSTIISSVNRYFTDLDDVKEQADKLYQAKATGSDGRVSYWKQGNRYFNVDTACGRRNRLLASGRPLAYICRRTGYNSHDICGRR